IFINKDTVHMTDNQALAQAIKLHSSGDVAAAEKSYRTIIQSGRMAPEAYINLASICQSTGRAQEAIKLCQAAVNIAPQFTQARVNLALTLLSEKMFDEAIIQLNELVDSKPNSADIYNFLGIAFKGAGQFEQAISSYEKALQINPDFFQANQNLGLLYRGQGELLKAQDCFQNALSKKPDYLDAKNSLGLTLMDLKKYQEAEIQFEAIIRLQPKFLQAHFNLGIVQKLLAKFSSAVSCFKTVLELKNDYFDAYYQLALIYEVLKDYKAAQVSLSDVIKLNPTYPEAHRVLGRVYLAQNKFELAEESFNQAISVNPNYSEAYNDFGFLMESQGKLTEAAEKYQKAIEINPQYGAAYRHLSVVHKFLEGDSLIEDMETLYSSYEDNSDSENRKHLGFALGKAYEDIKDYAKASKYIDVANQLKRSEYSYSTDDDIQLFDQLRSIYNNLKAVQLTLADSEVTPVFVVGMPRSGTTLVEQILASHSEVQGAGELTEFSNLLFKYFPYSLWPNCFDKDDVAGKLKGLAIDYLNIIKEKSLGHTYVIDKMPLNFRFIGFIKLIFPQAKIVHCGRDPFDTCLSIYKNSFAVGNSFSNNLQEIGHYHNLYKELMEFWSEQFPNELYSLSYESIVQQQQTESKALIKGLGLEWQEQCLEFYNKGSSVKTASAYQVRQPIYNSSVKSADKYGQMLEPLVPIIGKDCYKLIVNE
ncbi:MAG: hypothetical protein DRQ47_05210, partial [Gammaproteobacteria bacterium]